MGGKTSKNIISENKNLIQPKNNLRPDLTNNQGIIKGKENKGIKSSYDWVPHRSNISSFGAQPPKKFSFEEKKNEPLKPRHIVRQDSQLSE